MEFTDKTIKKYIKDKNMKNLYNRFNGKAGKTHTNFL